MSTKKKRTGRLFLILVVLAAAGAVAVKQAGLLDGSQSEALRGAPVRRGPLEITVTERGNLEAQNSYGMKSEVEGRSTILYLIEEGTYVKAGDLVAELDSSELVDKRVSQEIAVQNARAASTKANENLKIQEIENESLIAKAEQSVESTTNQLEKFLEGDKPQQLRKAEEDILLAEEELKKAQDTLEWSTQLYEKGFVERTELERDELAFKRNGILLEQARRAQALLIAYEQPEQAALLEGEKAEADRQLRKAKLQAVAQLADFQAAKESASVKLQLEEEKLKKLLEQVAKARIYAPVDGMIVYGREEGSRWGGGEPVAEGGEVRERQEIATIPGAGGMTAKASVHESVLKQVREGLRAIVRVDAIPGREFAASVSKVAVLPDQNSWFANPNLRLYRTDLEIEGGSDEMRPGMSCHIEILVDMIEDTLYVPLQAVYPSSGRNLCWVQRGEEIEERSVEVGQHNEKWVQILSGLSEGETVLLSPPPGYQADQGNTEGGSSPGEPKLGRPEGRPAGAGAASGGGAPKGDAIPSAGGGAPSGGGQRGQGRSKGQGRPGKAEQ